MIKTNKNRSGFVFKIDAKSTIKEILYNTFAEKIEFKGKNFTEFVDSESLEKYFSLLKEMQNKEVIFGEEIILDIDEQKESYFFIFLSDFAENKILLAANESESMLKYFEELMKINNKYVNDLRRNLKERIVDKNSAVDEKVYNEMSKLNNELVNLQRELNKKNTLLEAEKEKYKITLASIAEGVITANKDSKILYLNSKAEEMLSISLDEARGKTCSDIFRIMIEKNESTETMSENIVKKNEIEVTLAKMLEKEKEIYNQETKLILDDKKLSIEFSASYIKDNLGKVIVFRDISERKNIEARLKKYASTDLLTEVLNRRAGLNYLEQEMELLKKSNEVLTIIFIDINDLKMVNDNFGHQEGDRLLQKVSDILQQSLRKHDKVVRLGGDEFLLILPQSNLKEAEKIWYRLKIEFNKASQENDKDYRIWASHGVAEYSPEYEKNLDQLINEADNKMYKEKQKIKAARD